MKILLVSPYHGGSHESWANGLTGASSHDITALTLPARFWKWRMHGGAATLARRFMEAPWRPDLIIATDMLDLTTFLALTRSVTGDTPTLLYMHENQLTYPLPADGSGGPMRRQGGERDHHYAFINYSSMLAANRVVFNSKFHRDAWFDALPRFLRHFPEHNELASIEQLAGRSLVVPVGIDFESLPARPEARPDEAPLLLWNQRWEYDKNPAQLARALDDLAATGAAFRLAVCGQSFGESPADFDNIRASMGDRLIHFGFAETARYRELLAEASVTLSTATHEFFGIAVLEAMAATTFAALPRRLSYPELLSGADVSESTRQRCLYDTHEELVETLVWSLDHRQEAANVAAELRRNARRFAWSPVASLYDELFVVTGSMKPRL